MASLQARLADLITAIGTDYKQFRTWITGSTSGTLATLTTTDKSSLIAAINEVKAGSAGAPPDASEAVKGIIELATQAETNTGTDDARAVTPLKLQTRMAAYAQPLDQDLTDIAALTTTAFGRSFLDRADATAGRTLLGLGTAATTNASAYEVAGAAAAAQAASQPLDSDLTAIAALTTTAYGRAFLALADQAALMGLVPASSETVQGKIEIATQTETNTGTDDVRAVTPLKFQTRLAAYAQPLDSDLTAIAALTTTAYGRAFLALADQAALQALLGLDTDVALAANSDAKIATQKATKAYVDGILDANNAFTYKGVIDASTNPNYPAASAGHTYKISVAGRIGGASGPVVEVGDTVTALVDGSAAGNHATVGANWIILQSNIDGAVTGPASSTAGDLATFSGTTGKVVADSGVSISTDGTLATNNNTKVPTEGAIRTYLAATYYTAAALGNPDTDLVALYTTAKA